jgi:hypothetical protein
MEDLREQKQDQLITTVGKESIWTISLSKNDLFNEVSARSMYFVKLNSKEPVTSDANVILDDDKNLYDVMMENGIQELLTTLARRINNEDGSALFNDASIFDVSLTMGENHDSNLIAPLRVACKEFLVKKTLEQWYGADFGSEAEKGKIVHLLQYRRKSPARRVRPLL